MADQTTASILRPDMLKSWKQDSTSQSTMAKTQPQATLTVFTKSFSSKWMYHLHCSPCRPELLAPGIDDAIDGCLLHALFGKKARFRCSEQELISFPTRFGGLPIPMLTQLAPTELKASSVVTKPLVQLFLSQSDARYYPSVLSPCTGPLTSSVCSPHISHPQILRQRWCFRYPSLYML